MSSRSVGMRDLDIIQDMIAISADRLEGLRTQCATSVTLTQEEIRSLETKLIRMFSEFLLSKERLKERIPASGLPHTTEAELKQWLRVVGLSQASLKVCLSSLSSLEQLLEQTDEELRQIISNNPIYREEEIRRLTKAMQNLKRCKNLLSQNETYHEGKENLMGNLFWDSWDRHNYHRGSVGNIGIMSSPRTHRALMKQSRQQQQQCCYQSPLNDSLTRSNLDESSLLGLSLTPTLTPSTSPPSSPFTLSSTSQNQIIKNSGGGSLNGTPLRGRPTGTPPPQKKHQTLLNNPNQTFTPTHTVATVAGNHLVDKIGLTPVKLRAIDSQNRDAHHIPLTHTPQQTAVAIADTNSNSMTTGTRTRIHPEQNSESYSVNSDYFVDSLSNNPNNLQVPRSPCTPIVSLGMGHTISHRFTKAFKMMATCDLCQKQMFFGLKCKECKYRCHKDCETNVPPSCGLPPEFVDEFKKTLQDTVAFHSTSAHASNSQGAVNSSPNLSTIGKNRSTKRLNKPNLISTAESSSPGSSCNSSSPSSPALFNLHHQQQQMSSLAMATTNTSNAASNCISNACGTNAMNSSGGGSSSTSSNIVTTPSGIPKQSSQFNFPDVTITANCNLLMDASTTHTLYSSQTSNNDLVDSTSSTHDFTDSDISIVTLSKQNTVSSSADKDATSIGHPHSLGSGNVSCGNPNPARSTHSTVVTVSTVSSHSGTFYPRKLSSAGVDKRGPLSELTDTHKSNESDKTVSLSESTSASTDSDRTPVRLDSTEDDSGQWPRQNSLSAKEWDIPYGDLRLLEQIGKGRFGTVHRALWHGPVAVKLLKEDYLHDERTLEAFKLEVANFKKTRHENLVLFMGACMNPPYLAIVTSLCKGNTLYTFIHIRREKLTINKTTLVAQQIAQGMGYLHARGIVHKDLRTKNIFLESGKVIITDFGLFSSTKMNYCDMGLCVPNGWLCYMSPELMQALLPTKPSEEVLPFSRASDVYSFGTVWYELLCGEFPFRMQPPEAIIWQVGRGMKQTLANLHTSRDVKDILMLCWAYQTDDRSDFQKLLTSLEKLPKKRLARSPSHPVQLSRSAESVF